MVDEVTRDFILEHGGEETSRLLFAADSYPGVDVRQAARLIDARKKAARKLPEWYSHPEIDYPSSLSLEQCSCQKAAQYKQRFVPEGSVVADITGGLGVDSYFLSRKAAHLYYFERQDVLCEAARNNFAVLGADNITVTCAEAIDSSRRYDLIYADPARRGKCSERVYSVTDCEPDIYALKESLFSLSDRLLVKISPMADITRTLKMFPECSEVHVVSADGEVKEILLYMEKGFCGMPKTFAGNLEFTQEQEREAGLRIASRVGRLIYVPSKAILKAGAFKLVAQRYGVEALDVSTHIYTSDEYSPEFPGRCYTVQEVVPWNNSAASRIAGRYPSAELTAVNFPLDTNSLRKKLKISDGGEVHIFALTAAALKEENKKGLAMIVARPYDSGKSNIEWLFAQVPSFQKVGARAYKPGIETMKLFDGKLGHPHLKYRTIHIAGTNGKGSTSHMLSAGLAACGYKVGLYTSPHLKDFRERMRIVEGSGYRMISPEEVDGFIDHWKPFFEKEKPSFFEITTGMAFDFFARENVDVAIIETGLGGRLDSTNVITPVMSVITNIGLEHCEQLGYTLEEIAGEKAGIIKQGVPVVVGETVEETRPVFERKAEEMNAPLTFARECGPYLSVNVSELDLKGDYQQRNLVTLSAASSVLSEILDIDKKKFEDGVRSAAGITGLRGRWETLREAIPSDGTGGRGFARIICDTGHNAHGFRWIREQIDRICCDYDNIFFIFGVVADKDIEAIASLLPRDVNYIFTQASTQRALKSVDLANVMHEHGINGRVTSSVKKALDLADSLAGAKDLIFIGGSNFVVAEAI